MHNFINTDNVKSLIKASRKKTIPITLIELSDVDTWVKKLSNDKKNWIKTNKFKAAHGEHIIFNGSDGNIEMVVAGLGNEEIDPWLISNIAKALPDGTYKIENQLSDRNADLVAFGWAMAHYKYDHYLKEKSTKSAILMVAENCDFNKVNSVVKGTTLTRDLVNAPTSDMGPTELGAVSKNLAKEFNAKIKIITGDALLKKGFETIHTVGRAAEKEPRLIDITWGKKNAPKITLVGKGVCFDTGGLDIKPSSAMLTMKKDMGGAAHVLGLGQMIMESGLNIRLRILIPAVENNIAGNAFRPGDIIKSYEGTTIEVGNTDAEGRLVLCDALALASEEKPDLIMDFATLTGAARVAMGTDVAPFFTDDETLISELPKYAKSEHDPLWQLPLYTPYKKLLASYIADINNVASSGLGGAITAALFLKHFVGKDIPWVHFDISAWNMSDRPGRPKGGEAMGLRAVFEYLLDRYA